MKYLKMLLVLAVLAPFCAELALATAVNAGGGKKSVARMNDSSGYPISFNDDKPWKVFELKDTTTAAQVLDESGVAPKQGMVKRVCLESAPAIPSASDYAYLWDTVTAADMVITGAGRRIAPPIQRLSGVEKCVELNALFTSGLGIDQGTAVGSVYVYWRELGGYR
jgi:hypothetical protein